MMLRGRDVEALLRPRSVAVIGASATRRTQGNGVIRNLQEAEYSGRILPVHPTAAAVDGLDTVSAIDRLPAEVDTAIVAIPAPGVADVLQDLERAGVRSAIVFSNGFSPAEAAAWRRFAAASAMAIHGPNCMGLINFTDGVRLYPSTVTDKARPGRIALIAQSGSAAISLMNSTAAGLSKVITMGSEFQVTAPDYMRWFAEDEATAVVGIVLESIRDPRSFADAAERLRAAGKALVALKVGKSEVGALAVLAHTGAMISPSDAYDCFFERCGIPTVRDYDELIASVECFAASTRAVRGARVGIVGISGGETALASDVAAELGVPVASWSAATQDRIRASLPGASGLNPLDLGATVHHSVEQDDAAIAAILDDAAVDALLVIQDAQATLTPTMLNNYTPRIEAYARLGAATDKPMVLVSPTAENTHPRVIEVMSAASVPVLRGLRPGLVALRNLGLLGRPPAAPAPAQSFRDDAFPELDAAVAGALPAELCTHILADYGIPFVRSAIAPSAAAAIAAAAEIGFPLVLKIVSPDIAHRSDVGGVERGIGSAEALRVALDRMTRAVGAAVPHARIDGFELQEELIDHVEAMAGFIAAPPFGALVTVGTGGTLVELEADRAIGLAPLSLEQAADMIGRTRLGARLRGYRNLIPRTELAEFAGLVSRLSELAADLCDRIGECDLNPVLIRKGSGETRVVDALMVRSETRGTVDPGRS